MTDIIVLNKEMFPIDQLVQTKLGDKLDKAMAIFENIQKHVVALSDKEGEEAQTIAKMATVIGLSIVKKVLVGKTPREFGKEDWKEIGSSVSEYVILHDDSRYVQFIFETYTTYFHTYADKLAEMIGEEKSKGIHDLAAEMEAKTTELREGAIEEVKYIEDCLWLSLEGMIKMIAAVAPVFLGEEFGEFAQALSAFAFEYGRFLLYKREHELVEEFIQEQQQLDKQLEEKYTLFLKDLNDYAEQFYILIDQAFATDFRERFLGSVRMALEAGVQENEILKSGEEIDDFFLN